ncbi:MAG: menaquinone biosynthesis decarboxylase [Bacteroidales bacterium]
MRKFINQLEQCGELQRITAFVNPVLEITEITDRVFSAGGPALLFENNGTQFPVLINAFASDKRISLALGKEKLDETLRDFEKISETMFPGKTNLPTKISQLRTLTGLSNYVPAKTGRKGKCQQVIYSNPDLDILPVLKCWPHDGGRFITLPIVHTYNPKTGIPNAGMYRMQILDSKTTAMHWQIHKTGANHYRLWKEKGELMPVSVVLGGNPVYTYAATAPLPENIDEYILAGFLTGRKVKMVKCITNDIYVPEDADIVIEGYVDPFEPPVREGPFGDHTGFYSLPDFYPKFHVTCITHTEDAVYPATIVGIPPKEDLFFTKATEKIFLLPLKTVLSPEITGLHMPPVGVAHNLVIAGIKKRYAGQGLKVINSLFGAGQMMLSKYIITVSDSVNIFNYKEVMKAVFDNTDFKKDLIFCSGPLDILDHACDIPAFGGKLGIDATEKLPAEGHIPCLISFKNIAAFSASLKKLTRQKLINAFNIPEIEIPLPLLIVAVKRKENILKIEEIVYILRKIKAGKLFRLAVAVDEEVDIYNIHMVAWQVMGNSDPVRDHYYISESSILIDGTAKAYRPGGFKRKWPEIVCSDEETIKRVDNMWNLTGIGRFISSPSLSYLSLRKTSGDTIPV